MKDTAYRLSKHKRPRAPPRNPSSPWNHQGSIDSRLNLPRKIPIRSLADLCIFRGISITLAGVPVPRDGVMLDSCQVEHRSRSIIPTASEFKPTPFRTIKIKMNQELHHMSGTPACSHGGSKGFSTNPSTEPHCPIGQRIVGYGVGRHRSYEQPPSFMQSRRSQQKLVSALGLFAFLESLSPRSMQSVRHLLYSFISPHHPCFIFIHSTSF